MRISDGSSDVCSSDLTEAEWEAAAGSLDPDSGNQLDRAAAPRPRACEEPRALCQMFGDVWEWTGSAYRPHPGFRPAAGAVGEYNGKFMSGQFVLKGGSCATPRGHMRRSEEHTSELQSLMRHSYAVFCLKKKKITIYT